MNENKISRSIETDDQRNHRLDQQRLSDQIGRWIMIPKKVKISNLIYKNQIVREKSTLDYKSSKT